MPSEYDQVFEGEWVAVRKSGYRNQCCDCGMVHLFRFRVRADGTLEYTVKVDRRSTAAVRREKRKRTEKNGPGHDPRRRER